MESSNEGVTQAVEGDQGNDTTNIEAKAIETDLTHEQAVLKLRETAKEVKSYRQSNSELKKQTAELQQQLKSIQESAQQEQGNYKDLYHSAKKELEQVSSDFQSKIGTYAQKVVHGSIKQKLLEAKCSNPDAMLKVLSDKVAELEIDEDFNPDEMAVNDIVASAQKALPELFKSEAPKLNDGPITSKVPEALPKDVNGLKEKLAEALSKT